MANGSPGQSVWDLLDPAVRKTLSADAAQILKNTPASAGGVPEGYGAAYSTAQNTIGYNEGYTQPLLLHESEHAVRDQGGLPDFLDALGLFPSVLGLQNLNLSSDEKKQLEEFYLQDDASLGQQLKYRINRHFEEPATLAQMYSRGDIASLSQGQRTELNQAGLFSAESLDSSPFVNPIAPGGPILDQEAFNESAVARNESGEISLSGTSSIQNQSRRQGGRGSGGRRRGPLRRPPAPPSDTQSRSNGKIRRERISNSGRRTYGR